MLQKVRENDNYMKLSRMGSRYPSRLSFSRSMLRRLINDNWEIHKSKFDLDKHGFGTVVYEIIINKQTYSLVCFSAFLDDKDRSDRVIASKWDTAYTLHVGKLSDQDLNRLKKTIPLQESGRNSPDELILSRANKSVRLFQYVVDCLSNGNQPDIYEINKVGYLLRTTAVYGSGKFGLSDFTNTKNTTVFNQPFRAEMLSVYLIREFSIELVEHVARQINPKKAVKLDRKIKQHLGIGNSTGLGMAPFIIKHPKLINKWMKQYTKTLEEISQIELDNIVFEKYKNLLNKALNYLEEVNTSDEFQINKNKLTTEDLKKYISYINDLDLSQKFKWLDILDYCDSNFNNDTQEIARVQLIELYPQISEELAEDMADEEIMEIDGNQSIGDLKQIINDKYSWIKDIDFNNKDSNYLFWYVSAAKLEPRLGERYNEQGSELEQNLGIAKMVNDLFKQIKNVDENQLICEFLLTHPEYRGIVKRIQSLKNYPFSEVQDNVLDKKTMPIDMLRFKLSFFGANRYDPKSDRWLRVSFFSGAPYLSDLNNKNVDEWGFATMSTY
ncbi:MAG: hypothetical protein CM15mP57_2210 [Alphaproteobacteria bacterium]|nr:MAG: hypothetical protein CM15mP57_2210 [Alphaproteobacteria bacterium]